MKRLLLASVLLLPMSAHADHVTMTVDGTISPWTWNGVSYITAPSIDYAGLFGAPGVSISNDPFHVVWQADATCAGCEALVSTVTLSINGRDVVLGANGYLSATMYSQPSMLLASMTVALVSPTNNLRDNIQIDTFIMNSGGAWAFDLPSLGYDFNPTTDNLLFPHQLGGVFRLNGAASGYFDIDHVDIIRHTPAPVAGTGLLALLGLAWLAYRRRRT